MLFPILFVIFDVKMFVEDSVMFMCSSTERFGDSVGGFM